MLESAAVVAFLISLGSNPKLEVGLVRRVAGTRHGRECQHHDDGG
jgi:hypothetical protein